VGYTILGESSSFIAVGREKVFFEEMTLLKGQTSSLPDTTRGNLRMAAICGTYTSLDVRGAL
jgi:hypothetical protein